ncbi:MAG: RNA methyltransferase [Bacteroidales bacterium]|nr:RNA methyltransferase [Bacteroidales bacterium]
MSSTQNKRIKYISELQNKSRERKKSGLFVIEGQKELLMAIESGYKIYEIYYNPEIITENELNKIVAFLPSSTLKFSINSQVFSKIAYRESTGGIIAVAQQKDHSISTAQLSDNPLILVTEAMEKPGNLGALLRTADASNITAVVVCDTKADIYNPNVIRSSVGCMFSQQIIVSPSEEVINWLKSSKIQILCTALTASKAYHEIDYTKASAIVMGTEATGLTQTWLSNSDQNIIIPMQGVNDSLNVSVCAAVVVFEAVRQRL